MSIQSAIKPGFIRLQVGFLLDYGCICIKYISTNQNQNELAFSDLSVLDTSAGGV